MKKIVISGQIGYEVTAEKIRNRMNEAAGDNLDVKLSSPGGFVFDGLEIYNLFSEYRREYPQSQLFLTLMGDASSMASYIATNPAFDIVRAENNAVFMMHNPYGVTIGDYRDMKKSTDMLSGLSKILSNSYATRAKMTPAEAQKLMDAETWYFGDEIKTAGFADEMIEVSDKQEKTAALSHAKLKFENLLDKMRESEKSKKDISRAAAMIPVQTEPKANDKPKIEPQPDTEPTKNEPSKSSVTVEDPPPAANGDNNKEVPMDIKEIQDKHPELYAELLKAGKDTEMQRIKDVKAQSLPGHEALIEQFVLDGKTTGAEAATAIIKAENELQAKAMSELAKNKTVDGANPPDPKLKEDQIDLNTPIETRAKAEWDKSKEIRAEFFDKFEIYLSFRKNEEAGNTKLLGGVK